MISSGQMSWRRFPYLSELQLRCKARDSKINNQWDVRIWLDTDFRPQTEISFSFLFKKNFPLFANLDQNLHLKWPSLIKWVQLLWGTKSLRWLCNHLKLHCQCPLTLWIYFYKQLVMHEILSEALLNPSNKSNVKYR